jgi:Xaa-Pro aminopeptidase
MVPFDLEKLNRLMAEAGLDVILATSRHNVRYLTGGYYLPTFKRLEPIGLSQYVPVVGIPRNGADRAFYVGVSVPDVDEVQALEAFGPMWIGNRHWVHELRSRVAGLIAEAAAGVLRKLGLAGARIGIERAFTPVEAFDVLRRELPEASFSDATDVLARLRAVKSPREVELLRQVHERAAEAIHATLKAGRPGETSRQVEARLELEMTSRGIHRIFTFAGIGPSYNRFPSDRSWDPGRIINVDTVAELDGYLSDLARMASMGEAPVLALELFNACLEVQRRVRNAIGPGVPCRDIHRLGWEGIRASQWGDLGNFIAHGLGLVSNELPAFNADTDMVLESGMVISIEAEYRHPEVGHVKLEDTVVVTPGGCEGLGDFGREWCTVKV